ncbi:hypothetical protein [Tengunoibacter tsumagoiensis]|uniref:Uncharacterized protein n=1 Tax=Tengunoibacter tsumagoiensis TaxID=2014871 RepID=A0A401ZW78_9CHLR|nr:hypothetical protein [Tengunoibacter tsumagoiensis]GCE11155.1 hypothetical protein KTT_10140 [Tengunoibacter tsumagoiensis]
MEAIIVYGLVLVFFVVVVLFMGLIFLKQTYVSPPELPVQGEHPRQRSPAQKETTLAYGVIAALFAGFCMLTWFIKKK